MDRRRLLVLGCPRSGTRSLASLLRSNGVRVGHETMLRDGTVSSFYTVDDYWYFAPHGTDRRSNYEFDEVWHLTRDPLETIASLAAFDRKPWWHWQQAHTGVSYDSPPVVRATRFFLAWSALAEGHTKQRVAIENPGELLARLGINEATAPIVGKTNRAAVGWDDLGGYAAEVRRVSVRYGYDA